MALLAVLALFALLTPTLAQTIGETAEIATATASDAVASTVPAEVDNSDGEEDIRWITHVDNTGQTLYLDDARRPALYTNRFGDCLGGSAINVSRFDAAYYKDNMTVVFHLEGSSALTDQNLMMYIGVFAYGEGRFDLTFDPCSANIDR